MKKPIGNKGRAKVRWLKEGDRNSKYFHPIASSRQRQNRIDGIKDLNGNWVEGEAMEKVFLDHFILMFDVVSSVDMLPILSKVNKMVSDEYNALLDREFTKDEVEIALSQMSMDSSPGLHGLNVSFFRECWDSMGNDVFFSLLKLLNSGGSFGPVILMIQELLSSLI